MVTKPNNKSPRSPKLRRSATSHRRQVTAADLVSRLPLSKSLDESQSMIVALSPIFENWLNSSDQQKRLSAPCRSNSFLSAFQRGQLTIVCCNSSNASELKHLKQSLQAYLNSNYSNSYSCSEAGPINSVKIRVDLSLGSPVKSIFVNSGSQRSEYSVSKNAIDAIDSCSKQVSDPQLAASLQNLANTLKNGSST